MLEENTSFYNNVVNFSLNVNKFGMLIDKIDIAKSHDLCCYGNNFLWEIMNSKLCVYQMAWRSINTITIVLNHILLESADRQHSAKMCGVCISSLRVEL